MAVKKEKREPFIFHQDVASGAAEVLRQQIVADARIKNIRAVFPDGEDGDLLVTIDGFRPDGSPVSLINYVGDRQYLNGNGSEFKLDTDIPMRSMSEIVVTGKNVDTNGNTYPVIVVIAVEYD